MLDEEAGCFINFNIDWCGNENGVLTIAVDNDHNATVTFKFGQCCDEVY